MILIEKIKIRGVQSFLSVSEPWVWHSRKGIRMEMSDRGYTLSVNVTTLTRTKKIVKKYSGLM